MSVLKLISNDQVTMTSYVSKLLYAYMYSIVYTVWQG